MRVKIQVIDEKAVLPRKSTKGSACYDVSSIREYSIAPFEIVFIRTGLVFEIPEGYELEIRPRSGLSAKGFSLVNSPGTLDSDYRGELKIILRNLTTEWKKLAEGARVAQVKVNQVLPVEWEVVEELSETERGEGGFGSTG